MKLNDRLMNQKISWRIAMALLFSIVLSACGSSGVITAEPTDASQEATAPANLSTLKLALIPVLDSLPVYVAQQEGLFDKYGLNVEVIPVPSAPERDQVISAEQADGMVNEILSTQLYNKEEPRIQIVRFARTATADSALFRILAAGNSGIETADDLKGVDIGISEGTVIEYLTNRLLQEKGFQPDEIKTIPVPKISERMALLGTGELKAAMLPEPLSSLAVQSGAKVVLDDTIKPEISNSVYSFRKATIDQNPEAIRAFLAAIEDAVALINADPQKYSNLLVEQKIVPAPIAGSFQVPQFVTAGVPTQAQWDDVIAWAKETGILSADVSYQDSVTGSYLP